MAFILIADDNTDLANLLSSILQGEGHTTKVVYDGHSAIEYMSKENNTLDLLITDIVMPKLDGMDVISFARKHHQGVPIIAITGGGSFITASNALKAVHDVVDDCLQKPVTKDELLTCVKSFL